MSQPGQESRFDLARFVVGYLEHEGSIVAPPAYGVHEALLPDGLAAQLHVEPYLPLAFEAYENPDAVPLSVGHPLVEAIAGQLVQVPGHAQVFINHLRLDKKGLFDVAAKTLSLPNARLSPARGASEQTTLHHYMQLNFKAIFLSDEKQEQIISVVFDVQGGYAVHEAALRERLVSTETESAFPHLEVARPRWSGMDDPLSPVTLQALLPRTQAAAAAVLQDRLVAMQARTQRLLELDAARIDDYYDSLQRDLQQRLARSETADEERRRNIVSKIEALRTERQAKLADVQARHQVPKIVLPVEIGNRRVTITRLLVWNPLIHRLEPLVCEVCGAPGDGLHLCTSGHLHERPPGPPPVHGSAVHRVQPRVLPVVPRSGPGMCRVRPGGVPGQCPPVSRLWPPYVQRAPEVVPRGGWSAGRAASGATGCPRATRHGRATGRAHSGTQAQDQTCGKKTAGSHPKTPTGRAIDAASHHGGQNQRRDLRR